MSEQNLNVTIDKKLFDDAIEKAVNNLHTDMQTARVVEAMGAIAGNLLLVFDSVNDLHETLKAVNEKLTCESSGRTIGDSASRATDKLCGMLCNLEDISTDIRDEDGIGIGTNLSALASEVERACDPDCDTSKLNVTVDSGDMMVHPY